MNMDPAHEQQLLQTRRQFFRDVGLRFGGVALAVVMGQGGRRAFGAPSTTGAAGPSVAMANRVHAPLPGFPHFRPRAKSIIYLHMNGGPSQIDLWDYKPTLRDFFDKDLPPTVQGG